MRVALGAISHEWVACNGTRDDRHGCCPDRTRDGLCAHPEARSTRDVDDCRESVAHFRAGFESWAGAIHRVSEPCVHSEWNLVYSNTGRSLYPLDENGRHPTETPWQSLR